MSDLASDASPPRGPVLRWIVRRWLTLRMIVVGTVSYAVAFAACWWLWPEVPPLHAPVDRFLLAVQLCVVPAAFLFLCTVACLRIFESARAADPLAGAESTRWKIDARVLQNSLEQAAIFIPALLGLAIRIDPAHLRFLPILVTLWTAGRLLFWVGFRIASHWRAVGFEWTYFSSIVALGWFGWTFLG